MRNRRANAYARVVAALSGGAAVLITPAAAWWIARQERRILMSGVPLNGAQLNDAISAGVKHGERIRLLRVTSVPLAHRPFVRRVAIALRLIPPNISGLTARYGIFIRSDRWDDRELLAHELAHTAQYERIGGLTPFLRRYLWECGHNGYPLSELEAEAADVARRVCRSPG